MSIYTIFDIILSSYPVFLFNALFYIRGSLKIVVNFELPTALFERKKKRVKSKINV